VFKGKIPGRHAVLKKLNLMVVDSVKFNVDSIIRANLPFSIALDVATTKGMKSSYLGIIITYIAEDLELKNFAFDVVELRERHTGENLKAATIDSLAKFGLDIEKVSAIVTDGASNMSTAFK